MLRVLTVAVWLTIDATLDNVAHIATVDGDAEVDGHARGLRKRGWEVNARHPERGRGPVGWPPRAAQFEIELSDEDLAFIRAHIEHSIWITHLILDSPNLHPQPRWEQEDSLTALQRARDAIEALGSSS